ncbi:type II secretion system F family protein [Rubrivivax gelatinosus]|uniref:Type II secretion system protein F (GspF) n=1 Tax=Rubrivivax gelatinosus TaxID=28068 RepID=A0A4R2M4N3_RUBGE|nr:type II secretion system F family protein [Rubrivivax gelatinosus]MBK1689716.1 hypothetical protein [Rubrivivax gelatinosus]TCP01512.1 type II secretion system protein F (GspF) [Rubrivivax gelatinosus]
MNRWGYLALDAHGVEQRGEVEARDERDARSQLRALRLRPIEVAPGPLRETLSAGERLLAAVEPLLPRAWMPTRRGDLALLLRQLALMLRAGHTLVQALDAAARLAVKHSLRAHVGALAEALRGGLPLSQAMAARGRPFTPLMVQLTASAEASGELDLVCERMALDLERQGELRRQVLNTMLYPSLVLAMAVGVFAFLAVSVVPRFAAFIEGRGNRVPAEAQLLMDLAAGFSRWAPWLGAGLGAAVAAVWVTLLFERGRRIVDRLLLALPLLGGAIRDATMTRTAWAMSLLVGSGATALESLRIVRRIAGNRVYVAVFEEAEHRLLAGRSLARALDQRPVPPLMRHMVAVGEGTGQLDTVLEAVATHFRARLDARIKLMTGLIEPVLLIVVGAVVGFVYYTFFKTVMSIGGGGQ